MLIQMMLSIRLKVYSMHRCSIIADIVIYVSIK
ncbi:MAG: hypothetical protein K0R05_3021 [Anaerocolumna sp.]|jgi:hypothetical protein|nr:hypothetical protein [Anaerocolumna sp.]